MSELTFLFDLPELSGQDEGGARAELGENRGPRRNAGEAERGRGGNGRRGGKRGRSAEKSFYSHSMVAGGLLVTSRTTRFTSGTSLVTRVEIRASTSSGSRAQSAVIASSLVTGRSTIGWP